MNKRKPVYPQEKNSSAGSNNAVSKKAMQFLRITECQLLRLRF